MIKESGSSTYADVTISELGSVNHARHLVFALASI